MLRGTCCLIVFTLSLLQPLAAQRKSAAPVDATQVRVELAAVLLQSRRYDEAAREYGAILARQPNNFAARLGLARALAWSERFREAETELRVLRGQRPRDRDVLTLLRSTRENLEPRSVEAGMWLAEEPNYQPYRVILARALMREGKPREAIGHYEWLLSLNPHNILARHGLATALAEAREYPAALARYDTLISRNATADFLRERAHVHLAMRNLRAAEADALASLKTKPNVGAYLLLGDLHRWRGEYAEARRAYDYARMLGPEAPPVAAASAELARDQRPIPAFIPSDIHAAGWHLRSATLSDNLGVTYATIGARREVELALGVTGSVDGELRHFLEQSAAPQTNFTGFAFTAGLGREFVRGPWLTRVQGRAGMVQHASKSMFNGEINGAAWYGPWGFFLELARRPAYPTLLTASSIVSPDIGAPLTETSVNAALGGPLGALDVAFSVQRAAISDDNERSSVQLALSYPLTRNLALLGTGSGVWYADRSDLYWDPESYVAGTGGLELSVRKPLGFSFGARALAGPARSIEDEQVHTSLQVTGGVGIGYRTLQRDVGIAINYGTGRASEYQRLEANMYVALLR